MSLPRSTPEEQGLSAADLLKVVDAADSVFQSPHSIMIVRHGHVVMEGWWAPFSADKQHILFSLSKSFTSTAVGLAQAEGLLSVNDPVLKFFPDIAPEVPAQNLKDMRVRDLLRMATGHRNAELALFPDILASQSNAHLDLARAFLELPVPDQPGTHFVYNTPATYMLSAIVQRVSGKSVLEYLGPRLFGPLGIESPQWDKSGKDGVSLGGVGLHVRTEDIAKFGQLYLQRGTWNGRQLVPAAWVDEATSLQIANGSNPESDWNQGYGYQFWRCRHGFYRGDGAFGQYCVVMPQYDAVVAITSATTDMQADLDLLWNTLVPAFRDGPLAADPEADRALTARLARLALATQDGAPESPTGALVSGKRYVLADNPTGVTAVALTSGKGKPDTLEITYRGKTAAIGVGSGAWVLGTLDEPVAASGGWTSSDTYSVKIVRTGSVYETRLDLRFAGNRITVDAKNNVGFDGAPRTRAEGALVR
jgi:CubicO group peptidase (beta-lactamase class C family)